MGQVENSHDTVSKFHINSPEIDRIEVYGRPFPLDDFKTYVDIHRKYAETTSVDNVFVFITGNEECFTLVFHDYFPTINLHLGPSSKEDFFRESLRKYSLHLEIER